MNITNFTKLFQRAALIKDLVLSSFREADISIFHEFEPPPCGGGHQFLRVLLEEFLKAGLVVENNTISAKTKACLLNSFNFDFGRLKYLRRREVRMVHRVDGPITIYRGYDDGVDRKIFEINQELADATIFQSNYSKRKHAEMGLVFRNAIIIPNTVSPHIFNNDGRVAFSTNRKIKLLAASWSDNVNKGAEIYQWLEDHLDWARFEFTFVGRCHTAYKRIKMLAPVPSAELASIMREHDIFITGSRYESCPNVVLEALACGMPVVYHNSGGTPEVIGKAGYGFESVEEIPQLLNKLISSYTYVASQIRLQKPTEIAMRYLRAMGIK